MHKMESPYMGLSSFSGNALQFPAPRLRAQRSMKAGTLPAPPGCHTPLACSPPLHFWAPFAQATQRPAIRSTGISVPIRTLIVHKPPNRNAYAPIRAMFPSVSETQEGTMPTPLTPATDPSLTPQTTHRVALIGAPTDVGASRLGAAMGPDALRVAQLPAALRALGVDVVDTGNLAGPVNPRGGRDPKAAGLRNLPEAVFWTQAVHDAVLAQLQDGRMPIMLGGDHHLAAGSLSAVARHCRESGRKLRVLWLDAHSDCNTPDISPSGNIHGIPVANLLGLGPQPLIGLSGQTPALSAEHFCQVGLRSVDDHEKRMIRQLGLRAFDMRAIDELGMREVMHRALADVDADTHLHVSFDVDFLDPEIAPGTGTAVRGGPTYREAQLCMEMIADTGRLASLDIVELNPALDIRNQTAELVVDLVESLFGKSTLINR